MNLCTNRLHLRRLRLEDNEAIYQFQSDKASFPHANLPVYTSIQEVDTYILKMNTGHDQGKWLIWAICDRITDTMVGSISIWNLESACHQAELAYSLFPDYRGKGYMKEAIQCVLYYGFNILDLHQIKAYTHKDNHPSRRLLESLEFDYLETLKDTYSQGALMALYQMTPQNYKRHKQEWRQDATHTTS